MQTIVNGPKLTLPLRQLAFRAVRVLVVAWICILTIIYPMQRKMLYVPDGRRVDPQAAGLQGASELVLTAPDGIKLIHWWSAPKPGKPTVLYFHGNGGSMAWRTDRFALLQGAGYGVLMADYRGFGGSGGSPSEAAIIADAKLSYDHLVRTGIVARDIVLFGESLGTGVAVQVAAEKPVAGVILDSPFTSTADVAADLYPYLPVRYLMWDQFESTAYIGKIQAPLLVVHGDRDEVVPYKFGQRLFAVAHEPKQMLTLPNAGHTAPLTQGAWPVVQSFIERSRVKSARR